MAKIMAPILNPSPPTPTLSNSSSAYSALAPSLLCVTTRRQNVSQSWISLQQQLKCRGRFLCIFSDNRRQEQARKALESALGGKKNEFDKWNKEIKRREEVGGGGNVGGGGWFGWGGRFGWSNGDNFWQDAQQTILAVLGIILLYLVAAKGEVMLAVVFNPLLYVLRGARTGFTFITSKILRKPLPQNDTDITSKKEASNRVSAKESVLRKWRS